MNSKYKVLVLDLDGTLFGKQPIKPELIESIREIYNKKIRVILCSGRTLYYVLGIARCLGIEDFVICEEGTVIYDPFKKKKIIPVIYISGIIGNVGGLRNGVTISSVENLIEKAFKIKNSSAVAIIINSPGGSPVQS